MKKFLAILMSALLCMGLAVFAACSSETGDALGDNTQTGEGDTQTGGQTPEQGGPQTGDGEQSGEDVSDGSSGEVSEEWGDVLVVYFSATGNTERVANFIATATGGTLFELVPADPYTDDDLNYGDPNSRVSREHEDESLRNVELVTTTPDDWDSYDTIFLGYPIWWGIAAWPVNNFVTKNDFTGKTIVPFCTSSSSGIGQSGQLLADMAGEGNWLDGYRFSSYVSQATVESWLEELGI